MLSLFIDHPFMNCLYLRGRPLVLSGIGEEGLARDRLMQEFLKHFWFERVGIAADSIVQWSNKEEVQKKALRSGGAALHFFSLAMPYEVLHRRLAEFQGKLYGSDELAFHVWKIVRGLKRKSTALEICKKINAAFHPADVEITDIRNLPAACTRMLGRYGTIVVRHEYSQGGRASAILRNFKEAEAFYRKASSFSFPYSLEMEEPAHFVLTPFFEAVRHSGLCFFIHDSSIEKLFEHERYVRELQSVCVVSGCFSRNLPALRLFCERYCLYLHSLGYRGPADFDFMEDAKGKIQFCEMNARYPICWYPARYPLEGKAYVWRKVRLETNLSWLLFKELAGPSLFDPIRKEGLIPLNVGDEPDYAYQFALLAVAGTAASAMKLSNIFCARACGGRGKYAIASNC